MDSQDDSELIADVDEEGRRRWKGEVVDAAEGQRSGTAVATKPPEDNEGREVRRREVAPSLRHSPRLEGVVEGEGRKESNSSPILKAADDVDADNVDADNVDADIVDADNVDDDNVDADNVDADNVDDDNVDDDNVDDDKIGVDGDGNVVKRRSSPLFPVENNNLPPALPLLASPSSPSFSPRTSLPLPPHPPNPKFLEFAFPFNKFPSKIRFFCGKSAPPKFVASGRINSAAAGDVDDDDDDATRMDDSEEADEAADDIDDDNANDPMMIPLL